MIPKDGARALPCVARPAVVIVILTLLVWLLVALQDVRERKYNADPVKTQTLSVTSGSVLQRLALAFDYLLADVYWIRTIQHYGRSKSAEDSASRYKLLYPLLDITTTLDPKFDIAYRFGAVFLAEAYPDGPGQPRKAVALLQKGFREMPNRWQYLQDIGFVYYWWLHDYGEAARWFQKASDVNGAPWWLKPLAANTLTLGGNRRDSRMLWRGMRDGPNNEWMQAEAQRRLLQLDALDEMDLFAVAVEQFEMREGRPPGSWSHVFGDSGREQVPLDPAGSPYRLDRRSGRVSVSPQSPLFPLPERPHPALSP